MDIITLNGVKYIKRDKIKELENEKRQAEEELQLIKDMIGKSFADFKALLEKDVVAIKENGSLEKINKKENGVYVVPNYAQKPIYVRFMNDKGQLFGKTNRKLAFTIYNVLKVQEKYYDGISVKDATKIRNEIKASPYIFNKIVYNLQNGTFDKFIQQFHDKQLPKVNRDFKMPIENNTEKRKEAGYY